MTTTYPTADQPTFATYVNDHNVELAFQQVAKNRQHFPPNSDIWHLRFHWAQAKPALCKSLEDGQYVLEPMQLITKSNGQSRVLWNSSDAVVLQLLTAYLALFFPVHQKCEHIKGNGGGRQSVARLHQLIISQEYRYVCRTDIKGYYANIDTQALLQQIKRYVTDPLVLNLLNQYFNYAVDQGGVFHTPKKGIARSCALGPLLAGFHLHCIDQHFAQQPQLYYARYVDDFVILTKTRWHLRRAVATLNRFLEHFELKQHPDKTFIGKIIKGFDWMGVLFNQYGATRAAPRALANRAKKLRQLYEQTQKQPVKVQAVRVSSYLTRWNIWINSMLPFYPRYNTSTSISTTADHWSGKSVSGNTSFISDE